MELPSVGSADLSRPNVHTSPNVTLLSYNTNKKNNNNNNNSGYIHRFVQNNTTNNYVVSSQGQSSHSRKFNFPQKFRKRSKSASRLDESLQRTIGQISRQVSQTNLADLDSIHSGDNVNNLTYGSNNKPENNNNSEKNQVKLVGFSQCNSEFAPAPSKAVGNSKFLQNSSAKNCPNSRFQTLKTSREVKMERERLRQEKLHRLTQVRVDFCSILITKESF